MVTNDKFTIVYSLEFEASLELVLPIGYICDRDAKGRPSYPRAVCNIDTIESYLGNLSESDQNLLDLSYELSIDNIQKKYVSGKVKWKQLLEDPKVKATIKKTLDTKLVKFYAKAINQQAYLVYHLNRNIKACDVSVGFTDLIAKPKLTFVKEEKGISYELKLEIGNLEIHPQKYDIIILTDKPGSIIWDRKLVQLNQINGSKLKPFLKKQTVFIENRIIHNYFERFVVDVLKHVDEVDAVGFEMEVVDSFNEVALKPFYHLFDKSWKIEVVFFYGTLSFRVGEPALRKSTLKLKQDHDVDLMVASRNSRQESKTFELLEEYGFKLDDGLNLVSISNKSTLEKIIDVYVSLIAKGFKISNVFFDDKQVSWYKLEVLENFTVDNDWFDLQGIVKIGGEQYPFSALIHNIKNEDPWFLLNDGTYAWIPEEWMARYQALTSFIQIRENSVKLAKVHHHLMPSINGVKDTVVQMDELDVCVPPSLDAVLRPYQFHGFKWLVAHRINGLGACLADDMGLGKTLQTIAVLLHTKESMRSEENIPSFGVQLDLFSPPVETQHSFLKALIVVPASLSFNWISEINKYAPSLKSIRYLGPNRIAWRDSLLQNDVIITTYQTALSDIGWLEKHSFSYVILDESQYIRNKDAKIFKAVNRLKCKHKITLSGTPIENSLSDLWAQMEFINPDILGPFSQFQMDFKNPIEKQNDSHALEELKQIIDPYILRRTKAMVAPDLPKLIEHIHYSEMSDEQAKLFETEKSRARNHLLSLGEPASRIHILSSIMRLRQLSNHPRLLHVDFLGTSGKFDDIVAGISDVVRSGNKILVFSSFLNCLNILGEFLNDLEIKYLTLTGSDSESQRSEAVRTFQENAEFQVFLISLKAGGTGLNLTAADYVFIIDPWWNPHVERQAIARAHRIGRTSPVFVTRFISTNSIEEKILKLQTSKSVLAENLIDIDISDHLSDDEIMALLE